MEKVFGLAGQKIISVLIAISAFGNVMTVTFAQARVNQELAKEGVIPFPRFWASNWPFGSPGAGLLLHWIPSFLVILAVPFGDAYSFILDVEGYPASVIGFFVVLALFWLRHAKSELARPFRCWTPIALCYMAAQMFLIVAPFLRPSDGTGDTRLPYWLSSVMGLVVLLGGVLYWALWLKVLPALGKYSLVAQQEKLADGTNVVLYRKVRERW
nr:high-affinity methionine permease [Quercus suber]